MFEIQRFADEVNIPEELSDISEDIAREVIQEHGEKTAEVEKPAEEIDAEGNYTGDKNVEDVQISYSRYKDALDKQKDIEKQLAAYREKFGDINAQPSPTTLPEQKYQPEKVEEKPPEPKYFSADDAKQIDDAVTQMAMQMTGLTQEDVDSLDYLDDDDPKLGIWNHAKGLARIAAYNQIIAAQSARQQEEYRRSTLLNQSANDFNSYVEQQRAAENFTALQDFAGTEFFNAQSPVEKQIILEANTRLENRQATPTDFIIVRDFFTRAKAAFDAKNQQQAPPKKTAPKPQFPRTDKVNGTTGSGGAITNATLAEMINNTSWDKVPQQYKDILLNSVT